MQEGAPRFFNDHIKHILWSWINVTQFQKGQIVEITQVWLRIVQQFIKT